MGKKRVCLPTIVSFPKSHAFRQHANGTPGEGQLWNKISKCWEEPTLEEKEQLMGYKVGSTNGGLATINQRTKRLGQAMEGNTMRWLGAFLHASQLMQTVHLQPSEGIEVGGGFSKRTSVISRYLAQKQFTSDNPHHQTCAIVEELLKSEQVVTIDHLGGVTYR